MSPFLILICLTSLVCVQSGNHEHHEGDDKWQTILSQISFLWLNKTQAPSSSVPPDDVVSTTRRVHAPNPHRHDEHTSHHATEASTAATLQNGTTFEEVKERFRLGLAAIISIPIVGLIFLICCCYCCCKFCCSCEDEKDAGVIVLQNNQAAANTTTQVIMQQPVYHSAPPPPYHHPGQALVQPGQWPGPQQQPLNHPNVGYDNFAYYNQPPSAPPPRY